MPVREVRVWEYGLRAFGSCCVSVACRTRLVIPIRLARWKVEQIVQVCGATHCVPGGNARRRDKWAAVRGKLHKGAW